MRRLRVDGLEPEQQQRQRIFCAISRFACQTDKYAHADVRFVQVNVCEVVVVVRLPCVRGGGRQEGEEEEERVMALVASSLALRQHTKTWRALQGGRDK